MGALEFSRTHRADMSIAAIELTHIDLPLIAYSDKHLRYWVPAWSLLQLCKLARDDGGSDEIARLCGEGAGAGVFSAQ